MLPRARGGFVAHGNLLAVLKRPDAIGNDTVFGPVASADDVSGPGAGEENRRGGRGGRVEGRVARGDEALMGGAKRAPPRADSDLAGGLAGAVGIVAAESIFFAIAVQPLAIFVAFVGCHHHRHHGRRGRNSG